MGVYNYRCSSCEHLFDEVHKMDDRKIPVESPCPKCGSEGTVSQYFSKAAHVGDPFALGKIKLDDGMKNVLDKVRRVPGAGHVKSRFEDL